MLTKEEVEVQDLYKLFPSEKNKNKTKKFHAINLYPQRHCM